MNNFVKILRNQVVEGEPGGTPPAPKVEAPPAKDNPPAQGAGGDDNLDEFGYEKVAAAPGEEKPAAAPEEKPEGDKPIENPATGYEKKIVAPPAKEEPPPAPHELDEFVKDLPKEEVTKVKDFATKNALTKDQVKAYADMRRGEIAADVEAQKNYEKDLEDEKLRVRAGWQEELKKDAVFGGEKYEKNVAQVNKVLDQFLPEWKKDLTARGAMLPPYIMRGLAKVGAELYKSGTLVQGEPKAKVDEVVKDEIQEMYS